MRSRRKRTACLECGDYRANHVTTVAGIGPCTQLNLVARPDGTTIPERCLCARYVAPEFEEVTIQTTYARAEVTIGGDIVVRVLGIKGGSVKIGVAADPSISVDRAEVKRQKDLNHEQIERFMDRRHATCLSV